MIRAVVVLVASIALLPACSSGSQTSCGSSSGSVCISQSACTSDRDCAAGNTCGPTGQCQAVAVSPAVAAPSKPGPDAGPPPSPPASCGGELFPLTHVEANFLILFDKSGSMQELVTTQSKYAAATNAVNTLVSQHEATIRFGLTMFPVGDTLLNNCQPEQNSVAIGPMHASAIATVLAARTPSGNTPLAAVLQSAEQVPELKDPTRANYVLMVTDGMETCMGRPVAEVKRLFAANIKTYVVGFGSGVDATTLSSMASGGGTARAAVPRYYQVDDPAALSASLAAIVRGVVGCDFTLSKAPTDLTKLFVYVNGQLASRDTSKKNGWDFSPSNNRLTLYGSACESISNTPNSKVSTIYGCPDVTLIEGGPNTPCTTDEQCISKACSTGKCTGRLAGSACSVGSDCLSGSCVGGLCEGGTPAKPNKTACQTSAQCASANCVQGVCEAAPPGLPGGAACQASNKCASGSCVQGVCENAPPGAPAGWACVTTGQCATGACVQGVCEVAPPGLAGGAVCQSSGACASGRCTQGLCENGPPGLPGGDVCLTSDQCGSGICVQSICGRARGTACQRAIDCASNVCVAGLCEGVGGGGTGLPDGSPCSVNAECITRNCSAGTCQPALN